MPTRNKHSSGFYVRWTITRLWVYGLLVAGGILCIIPFLWMLSTSFKVDRELFASDITFKPMTPQIAMRSPYLDVHYYQDLPERAGGTAKLLDSLHYLVSDRLPATFPGIDQEAASVQVSRGLYLKLYHILPSKDWNGPEDRIVGMAASIANAELLGEILANVERGLLAGPVRFRTRDFQDWEPLKGLPISSRWNNPTSSTVTLHDLPQNSARKVAEVSYDFTSGDQIILQQTFHLPFDASLLRDVQMPIRPNDSWHDVSMTIETAGRRWTSSHSLPLANFDWKTVTWRFPGDESDSLKIKTWIPLRQEGEASARMEARDVRMTLRFQRAGMLDAWNEKLSLNYREVLNFIPFVHYLRVSLFLALANIAVTLTVCPLVAYAFARLDWPGRELCFVLMLATMMVPPQVLMIPHFLIWKTAGAYNTLTPLWLWAAFGNAFYIFLLRQFIKGIPPDLEEAARIDGCGVLRTYWHVMLPLVKPSLAAITVFTFLATWNDFMGPLLYLADQRLYPLAFGLYALSVQVYNKPTIMMAASVMMTVPIILVFLFAQKYFIKGISFTGMKG